MEKSAKRQGLERLLTSSLARRDFAKKMMMGGTAAFSTVALTNSVDLLAQGVTDVDILSFALNLEYLEAEFYNVAVTGRRIQEDGIEVNGLGRSGATTGGSKVSLDGRTMFIAEQILLDERDHVTFLRTALRGGVLAKPSINLGALNVGFNSQAEFLTVAAIFEDVGVSAYAGAAPLIVNNKVLDAAARIALTESQHAGILRLLAYDNKLAVPRVDPKAVPIAGFPDGRLFFVEGNGFSRARSTSDVLSIVYAGGKRSGGFFPDGMNGAINQV